MQTIQRGILLKRFNYSETSLILHFFTLEDGFQAYIFRGGKKKKGNILQALSIVEIASYHRKDDELKKVTEVSSLFVPQSLPYNPIKSGLAFFMAEVLSQVLYEIDVDSKMFYFLEHEIKWIDDSNELTNYPIWFLIKLADKIDVGIQVNNKDGAIFNFQEGIISNQTPTASFFEKDEVVPIIAELLECQKTDFLAKQIHKNHRKKIINHLIHYFQFHINGFKPSKSLEVMQTVFE